jgi:hypothetical protein
MLYNLGKCALRWNEIGVLIYAGLLLAKTTASSDSCHQGTRKA